MSINPFETSPLYEEDQVITYQDLQDLVEELTNEASKDPMNVEEFKRYITALRVFKVLALWLEEGKPAKPKWEDKQ